jgi:hypothetical protein
MEIVQPSSSYFGEIQKDLMKSIKEKQMRWFFEPKYRGEFVSAEDFFNDVFRTYLAENNRRTFLVGKTFTTQYRCETLPVLNRKSQNFRFFTPAIYWHHQKRDKENLIWRMDITLDFDFSKDGSGRSYTPEVLAKVIHDEFGYFPNYVWESRTKGNLQCDFLIKPVTGTPKAILYYEAIVKRIALILGADVAATNINNLYAVPHEGIWKFSNDVLDIGDFADVLEDPEIQTLLERKRSEKVISFTEKQIWKHEAIQALLKADFPNYRNHAAFTIALLYYAMGKDEAEAYDFLNGEWFNLVNDGRIYSKKGKFKRREVKTTVKSAYSGKYHGPSKEWIYLITGIEFPINLYKSSYIKKENGYQSADEVRRKIIDWVRENDGQTIKQTELVKSLNVSRRRFGERLEELKQEGIIDYITVKGRYSPGTTFYYTAAKTNPFEAKLDFKEDFDSLIDYVSEENII